VTLDGAAVVVGRSCLCRDQLAAESLVESLRYVVTHVLLNHVPEMPFAKEDEVVEVG
jgi:hypothetical protein